MDKDKRLVVGYDRLRTTPIKFAGMAVTFDPEVPADEVRLVDHAGKIVARATTQTPGK